MKIKHILSIILVFMLCFGVCSFALADENSDVPEGFIPIYTAEDLYNIRNDLSGKYILMNDIDLSVYENWEPIGSSETPFTGELDGNGNAILNLTIKGEYNDSSNLYIGLFGYTLHRRIANLYVLNSDIDIKYTDIKYSSSARIGTIIGYTGGYETKNCIASGNIKLDGFIKGAVGGLFGRTNQIMSENCVNYVDITADIHSKNADISFGGIIGSTPIDVINQCCNFGDITVSGENLEDSYRKVDIGGIIGVCDKYHLQIFDCYNRGDLSVDYSSEDTNIGGINGDSYAIERCYNIGKITTPEDFAGLKGGIAGTFPEGGFAIMPTFSMKNVYYNNAGLYPSYVYKYPPQETSFENAKLLSDDEMKTQESFVGFDFEIIWEMEENGYPVLQNQPVLPENIPERPTTTESTTESTTEAPSEPDTESPTEPSTEDITEPSTEPSSEPSGNECSLANLWIVRAIKWLFDSIWNVIKNIMNLF